MNTTYKEVKPFTTERLLITIDKAIEFAKENKFELKGEINSSYKETVVEKTSTLTPTMKKKLNKIIRRLEYKMARKNINIFFHFLNKKLQLNIPIKFEMSRSEAQVVEARKNYKLLKLKLEEARENYVSSKKAYYGSGKLSTEYMEK